MNLPSPLAVAYDPYLALTDRLNVIAEQAEILQVPLDRLVRKW